MKTIILTSIFSLFITCVSFAQPQKGNYVLGGSFGFSFNKTPSQSSKLHRTNASITPGIGKFVSEKYLLEGGLGYGFQRSLNEVTSDNYSLITGNLFSVNFGVTRYFPMADKFYFTFGGTVSPSYSTVKNESVFQGNETSVTTSNISGRIGASAGLAYFINEKWMLYTYVGVLNYEVTYNSELDIIGHSVYSNGTANSFGLGVKYILGPKSK